MKKRLLSAALALAMVLTMLPLTALPAFAAAPGAVSGSTKVTYYERIQHDKLDASGNTIGGTRAGWYYSYTDTVDDKKVTRYAEVTEGFVNNASGEYDGANGTYYTLTDLKNGSSNTPTGIQGGFLKATNLTVIGGSSLDLGTLRQSISIDVNSHEVTATISPDFIGGASEIKVYDKQYVNGGTTQGSFNKSSGITSAVSKTLNITVDGAEVGAISLTGEVSHTVTVSNGGKTGGITLSGKADKTQAQNVKATNSSIAGAIVVTGDRSHVDLNGVTHSGGGVVVTGSNAHVTVDGAGSNIGGIWLVSGLAADKKAQAAPYAEIKGGTVAKVQPGGNTNDLCTSEFKVTITGGTVTQGVDCSKVEKANVTIDSATVGNTTVIPNGKLNIKGSYADVGAITLGAASKETELKVEGKHQTVGAISVSAGTANLTIPADTTNTYGGLTVTAGASVNRGIAGGVWTANPPDAAYLVNTGATAVKHILSVTGGNTTFYTASQLGEAITAQKKSGATLKTVGATGTGDITINFKDGTNDLGTMTCAPYEEFALPSLIDGRTYTNWTDSTNDWGLNYKAPGTNPSGGVELNAKNASNAVNKINSITTTGDAKYLDVSISGNVISVSGAVTGSCAIPLVLDTNLGEVTVTAYYEHSTGKLSWANQSNLAGGMNIIVVGGETILQLSNKTEYTLRNAGIKVPSTKFTVQTGDAKLIVENISNSAAKNDSDRTALKTLIGHNSSAGKFEWSGVPAIEQAINAAKAGITDSQVTTWKQAAQREAFTKNSTGTYDPKNDVTGYDTVKLVPYLGIDVTDYKANGSITMKLNLKYRIEVTQGTPKTEYQLPASEKYPNRAYIAYTGTLGALTGEMKEGSAYTKVTFANIKSGAGQPFKSVHQDKTYVYGIGNDGVVQFNFPGTTGLGTIVIDDANALVTLYDGAGSNYAGSTVKGYYETIQAAVDNTEPTARGGTDDHIIVDQGYTTGNVAINVTGKARQFTIRTIGMTTITSATNGGVLIDPDSTGHVYTVKLNEDTAPATANVSVAGATGGSARVSTTTAKPGDKITISLTASTGYAPSGVSVRTSSGQSVSVSGSGSSYSFTMPAGATSVTVTPSFVRTTTLPFTDVSTGAWYYNGVEYCYNTIRGSARLMQGMSATTFGPNSGFTRAQVVQILWNIKGQPEPKTTYNPYTDISSIHYAYKAMLWATQNGYAEGYVDKGVRTFRPNQNVTRQEMAVFLWRAAGKPTNYNSLNLNAYTDGYMVYDWAQPAMRWAIARGVLSGQGSVALGNYLSPRTVAYRSEVAVTVMNFDKLAVFR